MRLYNKIFGKTHSISQEDIEKYISGNLSEKEKYEIELKAQSSDIDFDALDIFEENPTKFDEFKNVKQEISENIFKPKSFLKYIVITSIAATIAIFFIFYADIFNTNNNKDLMATNENNIELTQEQNKENEELFIISDESIAIGESSDKSTISDAENDIVSTIINDNDIKKEKISIEKIEPKKLETISLIDSIETKHKITFAYNTAIKHLANYKVIDYSFYSRTNQNEKETDIGLDVRYANENEKTKKQSLPNKDLNSSYFAFLEKALYKYDKKEYTVAISMFNTILEQYPNDMNAFFYKGLSFYQLKKYEKAIKYLNKTIESDLNIFHQEAEYYKALSLLHTNKKEGIILLQKIVDDALFYSQKAILKLNEINE